MMPQMGAVVLSNEPTQNAMLREWDPYDVARHIGMDFVRARVKLKWPLDFAWLDDVVARCKANGLKCMVVWWIENGPPLGDTTTGMLLPNLEAACEQLGARYGSDVWAWVVENEPDATGRVLPREYAYRVHTALQGFRRTTGSLVVAGELRAEGAGQLPWTAAWLANQQLLGSWPDAVGFHYYDSSRNQWKDGRNYGLRAKVAWLRNLLSTYGQSLPVWLTETGAASSPTDQWTYRSEELQAQAVVRLMMEVENQVPVCAWYRLADQPVNPERYKLGLYAANGMPKLALYEWIKLLEPRREGLPLATNDAMGPDRIGKR